jgi:type II secretion system (T2SS) protein E
MGAPIAGPGSGAPLAGPGVTPPSLSGAGRRFLSDILVELGFVTESQADQAVQAARTPGQPTPEKVLLKSGAISEDQLARAMAERYGLEHIDLTEFAVDTSAAGLLRKTAAKRYLAAPVGFADDGALVLAVADPGDALGLSDIAVMTKLAVRPAVAARSQIVKLLDTLVFMQEPAPGESQPVSTVIVPPDEKAAGEPPEADVDERASAEGQDVAERDGAAERELARLREELALALVARDRALAEVASRGEHVDSAAEREREEALASLRGEHERVLAAQEHAAEEALRAERASAQQALAALRANHDEALAALRATHEDAVAELKAAHEEAVAGLKSGQEEELTAERARRVEEVEAERARTAATIDAERERQAKELEALRLRGEEALAEEQARHEKALEEERAQQEIALKAERARQEAAFAEERARLEAELEAAREAAAAASPEDAERVRQLERELAEAREQVELTADADRRAEAARAALSALRDETERQAQVHALTERELKAELDRVRTELEQVRAELPEASHK